ncbi:ABC transporter substrate-binding protein [Fusobacterium sp. PH5-44]|uniref:ABC transporter substrate-binding protein n=1 Tax=unclassified Fusobacterium TaxID=2648384 RepID=UPI003D23EB3A
MIKKSLKSIFLMTILSVLVMVLNPLVALGTTESISIGVIAPTTGGVAVYGQAALNGAKLAIEEINANGGVLGGKIIELTILDDKGDATEGINAYNKLMGNKVKAIIGPVTSGVVAGVAEKAKVDNMLILTPTGTADSLTVGKSSVFRTCYTDSYQGKIAAKFAATKLNIKKVAVIYCNADEYSLGLYEAFKESCKENNVEIVATETSASMDDVNFSAQLGKIAMSDAEALFVPFYYGTVALLVPQAREAGFEGAMIGADGWDGIGDKMGDNVEAFNKCYFTNHYSEEDPSEKVQNFVKSYSAKYNDGSLNVFSALGYDAAYMIAQAINDAKSDDTGKIIEAMAKINFAGVTGNFTLDENGDPKKGAPIIEIVDGKMKWSTTIE